jgi:hypothetical protein
MHTESRVRKMRSLTAEGSRTSAAKAQTRTRRHARRAKREVRRAA